MKYIAWLKEEKINNSVLIDNSSYPYNNIKRDDTIKFGQVERNCTDVDMSSTLQAELSPPEHKATKNWVAKRLKTCIYLRAILNSIKVDASYHKLWPHRVASRA